MKSILIIGVGRFGRHMIQKLNEFQVEIMAIDRNKERIYAIADQVTSAQIGDATNREFLESVDVNSFDTCVVAIGDNFLASLEATSLLKELGARHVISRAARDTQMKFLLRNGADEVVYPEKQMAQWTAIHVSSHHIFDYMEISHDYGVFEIDVPKKWINRTINELDVRRRYHLNIIAIKTGKGIDPIDIIDKRLEPSWRLLVLATHSDIQKFLK